MGLLMAHGAFQKVLGSRRETWQEAKIFEEQVGVRMSDMGLVFLMGPKSPPQTDGTWEHPGEVKYEYGTTCRPFENMFQSQLVEPHEDILLNADLHLSFGQFNQCHHSLAFVFTLELVSPWLLDGLKAPMPVSKDKDFSPVKILRTVS